MRKYSVIKVSKQFLGETLDKPGEWSTGGCFNSALLD